MTDNKFDNVRPFLKWAGGKSKLINKIDSILPDIISQNDITYVEPFVGGGALLFWILKKYKNINNVVINDVNKDLIDAYKKIKSSPIDLIDKLKNLEIDFKKSDDKKNFFLDIRKKFNSRIEDNLIQSSYLIFLNKTCFNGLYRVNSKNEFNVPFGGYENPTICDDKNIMEVSYALQKVTILNGDYTETIKYINNNSFFYFDPPYKPLSKTSSFNSYSKDNFDDNEQIRLKEFCDKLNDLDVKWVLSNSDVKNVDELDEFFDDLYKDYKIERVSMKRSISSKGNGRGEIFELLIRN